MSTLKKSTLTRPPKKTLFATKLLSLIAKNGKKIFVSKEKSLVALTPKVGVHFFCLDAI